MQDEDEAISERNFRHVRKVALFAFSEKWKTLEGAQDRGIASNVFEALREIFAPDRPPAAS